MIRRIFFLFFIFTALAQAQLRIEIRQGIESPLRIAIPGFAGEPQLSLLLDEIIEADLANSGRFYAMADNELLSFPTQPEQVNINDWRITDTDYLLVGQLDSDSFENLRISFQLFDIIRGEQVLGFRLSSTVNNLRNSAHRIADIIFHELLGIEGIFSTQIAYVSESTRNDQAFFQIVIADIDGTNPFVVIESSEPLMSPAWSPDSRKIAYVSFENERSEIYVQDLATGFRDRVSFRQGINGAPSFSPDGTQLALTLSGVDGNLDIYILELDTQRLTRLTENYSIDTEPTWSPDGDYIYFTSDRVGNPQIYRVEARPRGQIERITFEGNYNARPRVSPDGESIIVVHQFNGDYRIALVDLETRITQVRSEGQLDESPSFAPNGDVVMYATREQGRGVLSSVTSDGRIHQRIASIGEDVREPAWSPYALR